MENRNLMKALLEKGKYIPQSLQNLEKIEYVREDKQILYLEKQDFGIAKSAPVKFQFSYRDVHYYKSEIELLIGDFLKWLKEKKQVIVLAGNEEETEKFIQLLEEKEIPYQKGEIYQKATSPKVPKVVVVPGRLSAGFECYDLNLVVVTGEDLFTSNVKKRRKLSSSFKEGEKIVFADLKIGDYVYLHKAGDVIPALHSNE